MTNGYASTGSSTGGAYSTGTKIALPSAVGKRFSNRKAVPGASAVGTGYWRPAPSSRSYVTPRHVGVTPTISTITSSAVRGPVLNPRLFDHALRMWTSPG